MNVTTAGTTTPIGRVPTGIHGLDELLEGGIPTNRIVALSGSAGSGKTTFGFQFLQHGITAHDEAGVYVTLEEETADLYQDMGRYGWALQDHVRDQKLVILKSPVPFEVGAALSVDELLDEIHRAVTQVNAKRIVFDSVAALGLPYTDMVSLRRDVMRLCSLLRELGCTALLTTEMPDGESITRFGIEQFVAQGAILLHVAQT
ncbi:MAG TPA: ATPase domain-containing protein, partial [Abditibacteriaceae bacterium]